MYGLNAVAFVFFACINILAYKLCKCSEKLRRRIMRALCLALLLGNVFRYGIYYPLITGTAVIPVEFSTVAYFAVPAILLISKKHMHSWAAYSGLMAGFFYYMAMIAAGGLLYNSYAHSDVYLAMLCHGSIYMCGFVTAATEICNTKETPLMMLSVVLIGVRAIILRPFVAESQRLLIYILIDAVCVRQTLPQSVWAVAVPVYYAAVAAFVIFTIRGFFVRNKKQYRKFTVVQAEI